MRKAGPQEVCEGAWQGGGVRSGRAPASAAPPRPWRPRAHRARGRPSPAASRGWGRGWSRGAARRARRARPRRPPLARAPRRPAARPAPRRGPARPGQDDRPGRSLQQATATPPLAPSMRLPRCRRPHAHQQRARSQMRLGHQRIEQLVCRGAATHGRTRARLQAGRARARRSSNPRRRCARAARSARSRARCASRSAARRLALSPRSRSSDADLARTDGLRRRRRSAAQAMPPRTASLTPWASEKATAPMAVWQQAQQQASAAAWQGACLAGQQR